MSGKLAWPIVMILQSYPCQSSGCIEALEISIATLLEQMESR